MSVTKPFGDLPQVSRTQNQLSKDQAAAQAQSAALAGIGPQSLSSGEIVDALLGRRDADRPGVLDIELDEDADGRTLVVPGEVIIRRPAAAGPNTDNAWKTETRQALASLGYVPDGGGVDGLFDTYTLAGSASSDRRAHLASNAVAAALAKFSAVGDLVRIPALQAGGSQVVVKAPGGPSPTEVILPQFVTNPSSASPVVVAIIDTGITADVRSADDMLDEVDRRPTRLDPLDVFGSKNPPYSNGRLDFAAGHGTFAAGAVRLVDPHAEIRVYRALDSDGFGSELDIANSIVEAVNEGAHVVNLSLGTHTVPADAPLQAIEAVLDWIDTKPEATRPVVVAAAGNAGTTRQVWPAASPRVYAVAALTPEEVGCDWSSRGEWVNFSTIGRGIVSIFVEGKEDSAFGGTDSYGESPWAMWSGTSFAAPQIAGAIARAIRGGDGEPPRSPTAAVAWLETKGTPIPDFGVGMVLLAGT